MIRTMVFDLDGTLVQTEKLKARSYADAAARLRPELDPATVVTAFKDVVGLSRQEVATELVRRFQLEPEAAARMDEYGVGTPWQAYVQIRLQIYEELLADDRVILEHRWPHNLALLEYARQSCSQVGLATMSHCRQARRVLGILGLAGAFDFVATRDDVEHGKPSPEIYELVARELAVSPAECLAIEDSAPGVESALTAGMACVAVSTPFTRTSLHESGLLDPRWIVDDPPRLLDVVAERIREPTEAVI